MTLHCWNSDLIVEFLDWLKNSIIWDFLPDLNLPTLLYYSVICFQVNYDYCKMIDTIMENILIDIHCCEIYLPT